MMNISYDLLVLSTCLLWIVVIVMGVVIFALTRQIGVLYERVAPAGALAMNKNLKAGQAAPELTLQTIDAGLVTVGGQKATGKSQLLFFLSPDCPVCKTLLPALKSAAAAEADWIETILCSDGMELDHSAYIKEQGLERFPYVVSELLGKTCGVARLPYAVVIDEQGKIASLGMINSREHLDSLFEAKEHNVASMQDYLAYNTNARPAAPAEVKPS